MRKWILVTLAAMAISIPSLAQSSARNTSAEQQVKAVDNQYRESALKNDAGFAEQHVADNFMGVGPNGQLMTKDQVVQGRKEGTTKYDAIDLKATTIHMYGNTAVIDHEAHVIGSGPGGPFDGDYRATLVWVREGGQWKLVSFQSTPVRSTQAAANK